MERMSSWILECLKCNQEFAHTEVTGSGFDIASAKKPEFPAGGSIRECPHCRAVSVYQPFELVFQRNYRSGQIEDLAFNP
jgi:hypothetical protein